MELIVNFLRLGMDVLGVENPVLIEIVLLDMYYYYFKDREAQ